MNIRDYVIKIPPTLKEQQDLKNIFINLGEPMYKNSYLGRVLTDDYTFFNFNYINQRWSLSQPIEFRGTVISYEEFLKLIAQKPILHPSI